MGSFATYDQEMDRAYSTTLGTHTVQCLYGVNGIAVNFMNTKETMDGWRPCFRFVVSHTAELDIVIGWVYCTTTDLTITELDQRLLLDKTKTYSHTELLLYMHFSTVNQQKNSKKSHNAKIYMLFFTN